MVPLYPWGCKEVNTERISLSKEKNVKVKNEWRWDPIPSWIGLRWVKRNIEESRKNLIHDFTTTIKTNVYLRVFMEVNWRIVGGAGGWRDGACKETCPNLKRHKTHTTSLEQGGFYN